MKKTITQAEFDAIYAKHQLWLKDNTQGAKADLSNTDLASINFPQSANLEHANLAGVDLARVDLSHCSLFGADLSGANLSGTKLVGTDIGEINLDGAFLHGIILEEQNRDMQWQGLEHMLKSLEADRLMLLLDKNYDKAELAERERQIELLETEQNKQENKDYDRKRFFGKRKEDELISSFELFDNSNSEINKEIKRYQGMFIFYISASVILFISLLYTWWQYFATLQITAASVEEPINHISVWWYLAPSIIITLLIVGAIYQAQGTQQQLVKLRKSVARIRQILTVLQAYVRMVDSRQLVNTKINEVLDSFINYLMQDNLITQSGPTLPKELDLGVKATDFLPYKSTFNKLKAIAKSFAR